MKTVLEVCCGSMQAVEAAIAGGADRIELCSGLAEGGVTPSVGLICAAVKAGIPVNVLIRPRPGDFHYNWREERIMADDVKMALESGANGVVIGALTPVGNLSCRVLDKLVLLARNINKRADITLHRAFDLCADPTEALEIAVRHGFDRVLTSGCAPTAIEGLAMLRQLKTQAAGRIKIMAGSGVNAANAKALAEVADELHASARRSLKSTMLWQRKGVAMGNSGEDEYTRLETNADEVKAILLSVKQ